MILDTRKTHLKGDARTESIRSRFMHLYAWDKWTVAHRLGMDTRDAHTLYWEHRVFERMRDQGLLDRLAIMLNDFDTSNKRA